MWTSLGPVGPPRSLYGRLQSEHDRNRSLSLGMHMFRFWERSGDSKSLTLLETKRGSVGCKRACENLAMRQRTTKPFRIGSGTLFDSKSLLASSDKCSSRATSGKKKGRRSSHYVSKKLKKRVHILIDGFTVPKLLREINGWEFIVFSMFEKLRSKLKVAAWWKRKFSPIDYAQGPFCSNCVRRQLPMRAREDCTRCTYKKDVAVCQYYNCVHGLKSCQERNERALPLASRCPEHNVLAKNISFSRLAKPVVKPSILHSEDSYVHLLEDEGALRNFYNFVYTADTLVLDRNLVSWENYMMFVKGKRC